MTILSFLITLVFFGNDNTQKKELKNLADQSKIKADSLVSQGIFEEALIQYEKAFKLYTQAELWNESLDCLNEQCFTYDKTGEQIKRNDLLNKGIYLSGKKVNDSDHKGTALLYRQKGEVMIAQGKLDSAQVYISKAKKSFTNNNHWEDLVNTQLIESVISYYNSDFISMQTVLQDALQNAQNNLESNHEIFPEIFQLLGVCNEILGDYEAALKVSQKAINIYTQKENKNHSDSSRLNANYHNMGMLYLDKGDYDHAIEYLKQSIQYLNKTNNNNKNLAGYYSSLGLIHLRKKHYVLAEESYLKAESFSINQEGKNSRLKRNIYTGLATIYRHKKDYNKSLLFSKKAQNHDPKGKSELVQSNLGQSYLFLNQKRKALKALTNALSMTEAKFGKKHPESAKRLMNIGFAYFHWENYSKAEDFLNRSLTSLSGEKENLAPITDKVLAIEVLKLLGKTYLHLSSKENRNVYYHKALKTYNKAAQLIDDLRFEMKAEGSKLALQEHTIPIIEGIITTSLEIFKTNNDSTLLKQAFQNAEKGRAILLLESLVKNDNYKFGNIPDSLNLKEKELQLNLSFYRKKLHQAQNLKDSPKVQLYQNYFFETKKDYDQLVEYLKENYPDYYNIKFFSPKPSIPEISKKLDANSLVIEYFVGDNFIYVFTVNNKQKLDVLQIPKKDDFSKWVQDFNRGVKDYQFAIQDGKKAFDVFTISSNYLYQLLLEPILNAQKNVNNLFLIPHAELNYISFEALLTQTNSNSGIDYSSLSYLVKDYVISYQYSAYLFQKQNSQVYEGKILSLAPATFEKDNSMEMLPATIEELENINKYYNGLFYNHKKANKRAFFNEVENYNMLHLATHGFNNDTDPLLSHILFSGAFEKLDDKLFAFELSALRLNAELAVLTSCQSGTGTLYKGEGVYSFARSFTFAGVKSLVMSLWNLEDNASSDIISAFYNQLASGASKDRALREAKLNYIKNGDPFKTHPSFWAGLIQIGNTSNIKKSPESNIKQIGVLAIIVFPLIFITIFRRFQRRKEKNKASQ